MKKLFFVAAMSLLSCQLFAQVPNRQARPAATPAVAPPPLATREVSGKVVDSKGETIIGANITLSSKLDTIRTATNTDGIFVFHDVKSNVFQLQVTSVGYTPKVLRNSVSDIAKRIPLPPIVLADDSKELTQVNINGTPSITYKTDTVEYRASDYKVRENSTVDELLKHMEGFEVGSDGSVTHQGQAVTKARLNGKDYAGGNLAQAIQSLPADIVEKIQVVDDYGDQAARTGIKDGDPSKVLNITTLANKSIGNIARITATPGTSDRYNYNLFYNRINANEVITLNATTSSVVPGVINSGAGSGQGGAGGNSNSGTAGVIKRSNVNTSYRDQVSKTTQVNGSYTYSVNDNNTTSQSNGAQFFPINGVNQTSLDTSSSTSKTHGYSHAFTFDYEFQPDSQNYLRVRPNYNYNYSFGNNTQSQVTTGFENSINKSSTNTSSTTPTYGATITYQFLAKHDHRQNISISYAYNYSGANTTTGSDQTIIYKGTTKDSVQVLHRLTTNNQTTKNSNVTLQYAQPLSSPRATVQQFLEFNEQYSDRSYDVNKIQGNISQSTGAFSQVDSLTNIYKYSFTQGNFAAQYRRNGAKSQLTLGVRGLVTSLDGNNISRNTTTTHNDFYFVPVFRYQYQWSRTEQISVNYTGNAQEPSFAQIQPVPDYSINFLNPIYGNPNLKPSFSHNVRTQFNDYIANSKFNFSLTSTTSVVQNQIVTNDVRVVQTLAGGGKQIVDGIHYLNTNGTVAEAVTYNIAKQLNDRAYNLELNGTMNWSNSPVYSSNARYDQTYWHFNERFSPIITPNTSLEFRPYISYDIVRNFSTLPSSNPAAPNSSQILTTQLDFQGRVFLGSERRFSFQYDISKNYISGITGFNKNPFIVNSYVEYEFFARKNGIVRLSGYDVFKQAVFLNHQVTSSGYVNTESNTLSRYFTLSLILNLQKFSGSPQRNGRAMQRRGDGSFIVD